MPQSCPSLDQSLAPGAYGAKPETYEQRCQCEKSWPGLSAVTDVNEQYEDMGINGRFLRMIHSYSKGKVGVGI